MPRKSRWLLPLINCDPHPFYDNFKHERIMSLLNRYILNKKGRPVVEPNLLEWAAWMETGARIVAQDHVGKLRVSTIFLGLDHNFSMIGAPILWETAVLGRRKVLELARCGGSREQAEAQHAAMVAKVRQRAKQPR